MERMNGRSLLEAMKGRWLYCLHDLAPSLRDAIAAGAEHVPCPVHPGSIDGFRLFANAQETGGGVCNTCGAHSNGVKLLAWANRTSLDEAQRHIAQWAGVDTERGPAARKIDLSLYDRHKMTEREAIVRLRDVWSATKPIAGTPVERYLANRKFSLNQASTELRYHPGLKYYQRNRVTRKMECLGVFPAMIAPVRDSQRRIRNLHRTFLTEDGAKAPVPKAKKLMTPVDTTRGSSIQLFPATRVLGLAEGIETALAARAVTRLPVWAAVAAGLLPSVELPASVRHVVIFADKDRQMAGIKCAEEALEAFAQQGRTVEILLPTQPIPDSAAKGIDWWDVYELAGASGFPERWRI